MKQTDPQFKLRLPPELKEELDAAAERSKRSLNAEIVSRLQSSFTEARDVQVAEITSKMVGDRLEQLQHEVKELRAVIHQAAGFNAASFGTPTVLVGPAPAGSKARKGRR